MKPLKVAVASGKGGTGKSCVAASLALGAGKVFAIDADVEEPNLALLLEAERLETALVKQLTPVVDEARCDFCGECARACRFGAINVFGKRLPLVSAELCHACGVCTMACPQKAISEVETPIGELRRLRRGDISLFEGRLWLGQMNPVPVIQAVMDLVEEPEAPVIIDCAPGTSCPMAAAVRRSDFVLMVTEPTPFGRSDLAMALEVVRDLNKPAGVVLNRADLAEADIEGLCRDFGVLLMASLPFSRTVPEGYARGLAPALVDETWRTTMASLWERIGREMEA